MIATAKCPYSGRLIVVQKPRWWGYTNTWEIPLRHGPVTVHRPASGWRAPARCCRMQAARWKRRRFVQQLRRSLA